MAVRRTAVGSQMMFSIVIPTRDRVSLLAEALDSVWAQSYADYEVIVVDDGSTDGTWDYLESLGSKVKAIRIVSTGPGAARNAGVAQASGDYVAFLDSDDIWFRWTLETFARLLAVAEPPSIICASVMQFADATNAAAVGDAPLEVERFADLLSAAGRVFILGSGTVAVRRTLLIDAGGFTPLPINGEDLDLLLRLGDRPGFVHVLSPTLMGWRRHGGGMTSSFSRSLAGSRYLLAQENAGRYPGGARRAAERREMLTRHIRPVSIECLRHGSVAAGFELYRHSLQWHMALHRWRYLAGFPVLAVGHLLAPHRRAAS